MNEAILFTAAFVNVLALGLQNLNVVRGHYLLAFLTSFAIGIPFVAGVTMLPDATWSARIAFLLGGPFGITASMRAHPWLVRIFKRMPK